MDALTYGALMSVPSDDENARAVLKHSPFGKEQGRRGPRGGLHRSHYDEHVSATIGSGGGLHQTDIRNRMQKRGRSKSVRGSSSEEEAEVSFFVGPGFLCS